MSEHSSAADILLIAALMTAFPALAAPPATPGHETEIRYLSGTGPDDAVLWEFRCSAGRNCGTWTTIPVPSVWEQQGFGTYNYGVHHRASDSNPDPPPLANEQGRYRTTFEVPVNWRHRAVRIVFDGSMTDTAVWVNGQSAGPVHQGSFYRFHYDITSLIEPGEINQLEVVVSELSANPSVNRAERLGDYWIFGGLFRPVWLEARPARFIESAAIDARADGSVLADVHLGPGIRTGEISAQIFDASGAAVATPFTADVAAGATQVSVHGRAIEPKLWTAETPDLYQLRLTLSQRGKPAHTRTERFGFRSFEVRERDGLYLNGRRIILKGVNRHAFRPETGRTLSREHSYADVRLIKEMNMNAVRTAHYPPDAHFLEACDELGLYVLDELAGWQGAYDTPTGARLIGEMVRRDVNHPAVLFWVNGNEGGWNADNDQEFSRWDPRRRPVLHPWALNAGVNTDHYENYRSTSRLCSGPDIFMPTEFLHGLYDGGGGAGLRDYWDVMMRHPRCAGGFLWAFADEGILRTDRSGRIDTAGNLAADGIVGPHHEREGSFYAIKEIWSPVRVLAPERLTADWDGTLRVENNYDFSNLNRTTFEWRLLRMPSVGDSTSMPETIASGHLPGPDVPPRGSGILTIAAPGQLPDRGANDHDLRVLHVTAKDWGGRDLWTWSHALPDKPRPVERSLTQPLPRAEASDDGHGGTVVRAGASEFHFDGTTGHLTRVVRAGKSIAFGNGPRVVAFRRNGRRFDDISGTSTLAQLTHRRDGSIVIVEARYTGPLRKTAWSFGPDGAVQLDYEYAIEGVVDLSGVQFDYPEAHLKAKRWLGRGPYRVWQNRMEGGVLDVWRVAYNDPVPGQTFEYPEFKGYFDQWYWLALQTNDGEIRITNPSAAGFLGLYTPQDGIDGLLELPPLGIALLDVIPAMRNKFDAPDALGPQSQPRSVTGVQRRSVHLDFQ